MASTRSPPPSSTAGTASASRSPPTSPQHDNIKSAILANSTSGWSPLRISKPADGTPRNTPIVKKPLVHGTPVRRTSSSFSHVRNNNLVSNSIFKSATSSSSSSNPSSSDAQQITPRVNSRLPTSIGRRVSGERRVSLERRRKAIFPDGEHARSNLDKTPLLAQLHAGKGLDTLGRAAYVSKSPFRNSVSDPVSLSSHSSISASGSERAREDVDDEFEEEQQVAKDLQNTPTRSPPSATPGTRPISLQPFSIPSTLSSLSSTSSSGTPRSNLVSRRLHGPRSTSGGSRRPRNKTVTFDEQCDVVEFDVESFEYDEDEEEAFQSDYEVDYRGDGEGYDSTTSGEEHEEEGEMSYMSDPEADRSYLSSLVEDELDGLIKRSPRQSRSPRTSFGLSPSASPRPSTPTGQITSAPSEELDAEDGVPLGRSHHIERFRAAHSSSSELGAPLGAPMTPLRKGLDSPRAGSPSPGPATGRALPKPPGALVDDDSAPSTPIGGGPAGLAPLALSPSKKSTPLPLSSSRSLPSVDSNGDLFSSPSSSADEFAASTRQRPARPESPVRPSPLQTTTSASSLESQGRASPRPRIDREEVRKRLLRSRGLDSPSEQLDDERQSSPVREPAPESPAPAHADLPVRPQRPQSGSMSFDLHQPGQDLGDVRSALDRLMIGVERGFTDDVTSLSMPDSRDQSFADDTANSSILIDRSLTIEEEQDEDGEGQRVFITEHLQAIQTPVIEPRSPLLGSAPIAVHQTGDAPHHTVPEHEEGEGVEQRHGRGSSGSSATVNTEDTAETEEEVGPLTPLTQNIPVLSIPGSGSLSALTPNGAPNPFAARGNKYAALGPSLSVDSIGSAKEKALPATPKPRISGLDFGTGFGSGFGGDFASDLLVPISELDSPSTPPSSTTPSSAQRIPSAQAMPPPQQKGGLSGKEAIRAHEQAIIERRRALRREMEGEAPSGEDGGRLRPREDRPQRRRSQSTGDALDFRSERAALDRKAAADQGSAIKPSLSQDSAKAANGAAEPSLSASISQELDHMHGVRDRKYFLRERPETIYAAYDQKVSHHGLAGDVDSGKAWRTVRRPSDMNEYAKEIRQYRARAGADKAHGKVFVKVLGVRHLNVPIPRLPTLFTCTLNNGIHFVTTPECPLEKDSAIDQEFELIEHNKLEFTLTLKVRRDKHLQPQVQQRQLPPPRPQQITPPPRQAAPPPKEEKKSRWWSSSPKKSKPSKGSPSSLASSTPRATPSPPPPPMPSTPIIHEDPLVRFLKPDGTLGRTFVSFKDMAPFCDTTLYETTLDLVSSVEERLPNGRTGPRKIGDLVVQMFRLPPLPGVPADQLPQSLEECLRGMRHVNWHKIVYHEGVLTQNGGDCKSWRRRQFRIIGAKLVAFNDVTKKATATIEMKQVVAVYDDNAPESNPATVRRRARDSYDAIFKVERSFRLLFADEEEIEFFADTDEEKARWLHILRMLVGKVPPNPLWAELVWQRQQDLSLFADPNATAATASPSSR